VTGGCGDGKPVAPRGIAAPGCRAASGLQSGRGRDRLGGGEGALEMDIYHAWFNLREGVSDAEFAWALGEYLGHLKEAGHVAGWRMTRRKLGLAPGFLPEFHVMIEVEGLAQLDGAFGLVAGRAGAVEGLHHAVNSRVRDAFFALYRDFPDPHRQYGQERF
jgi:Family of unknown function (DUF6614)